ncbi:MAG: four helix bundle protein [Candidimonas sp.]|nr:MAG: four helix bundle protein [Candidimonas sp.]TAM23730.1 MAG: four helix bundle protein [Candidimonas sp.]
MALHTELKIYEVTYQLLRSITEYTRSMHRDFKNSIGIPLRAECAILVLLIYRANSSFNKLPHLAELQERLKMVELTVRLCVDLRLVSPDQQAHVIDLTGQIGKQAKGWANYSKSAPAVSSSRRSDLCAS